jgi:RNA polymerase primary sigma factor
MSWWHDQAGRYPLLTPAQEITLGQQVRAWLDDPDPPPAVIRRGQRARERFVQANLRLVINVADRYRSVQPQYADDLIQAGNMGLITAVTKFDPARGYKFSTYAFWWIRQAIHSFLEHHSRSIRLPTTHAAQYTRLQATTLQLREQLNRPPTRRELADATGWTLETIDRVLTRPTATVSLDAPNLSRDDGGTVAEVIAAPGPDLLDLVDSGDQVERLMAAVEQLSPMAQRIIEDQFLSPVATTQHVLARELGIGREQLRTITAQSLNQLGLILRGRQLTPPAHPAPIGGGDQIALPISAPDARSCNSQRVSYRRRRVASMEQVEQGCLVL